jgi:hypothetical protein
VSSPHVFLFRVGKKGLIEEVMADWQRQLGWLKVDK